MEVAGDIGIFESQKACGPLRRHLFGARRFLPWLLLAIYLVCLFSVTTLMERLFPGSSLLGILLVAVPAYFLWVRMCGRMAPKAWLARGVPLQSHVTYRIDDEALTILGATSETRLKWEGLSQVAPGKGAWLFIGPGLAYFLPLRFFADKAAEKAFLAACFERLGPAAQSRSREVAALVAGT